MGHLAASQTLDLIQQAWDVLTSVGDEVEILGWSRGFVCYVHVRPPIFNTIDVNEVVAAEVISSLDTAFPRPGSCLVHSHANRC